MIVYVFFRQPSGMVALLDFPSPIDAVFILYLKGIQLIGDYRSGSSPSLGRYPTRLDE